MAGAPGGRPTTATSPGTATRETGSPTLLHRDSTPSVGAIAVYRPGSGYSQLGHVAVVIAASSTAYTISEMYFISFGEVNTRTIWWPDPHIQGFIPLSKEDLQ